MTINEYQNLAMRTANVSINILMDSALGLAGEAGECVDIIKKHLCQNHPLDRAGLIEELGDLCWYVALCATAIGEDLESILNGNIEKLMERYPEGFTAECSINRSEGSLGSRSFVKLHGGYVNKTEAAKLIGVSRATVYDMIKDGRLSTDPEGRFVKTSDIYKLLNSPTGGVYKRVKSHRN